MQRGLGIDVRGGGHVALDAGPGPHRGLPPAIAADIDEHADQPGFLVRGAERDGSGGLRRAQKRLLHEIAGIVGAPRQPPGQPEQPLVVLVEEVADPRDAVLVGALSSRRHRDGLPVHYGARRSGWGKCWRIKFQVKVLKFERSRSYRELLNVRTLELY